MPDVVGYINSHKAVFDAMQAASSAVSLIGWLASFGFLLFAWRRGNVASMSLFGMNVTLAQKEVAIAMSRATRERALKDTTRKPGERSQPTADLDKLNTIIARAFTPEDQSNLIGRAILWVDDNPTNNDNEATALRKIGLVVDQVTSTDAGLSALAHHSYDLVISDMGRGSEKFAGYQLLEAIRKSENNVPYVLYSAEGSKPAHRADALSRGALGSTDYPHELLDLVVSTLGNDR